jgi:hypothetical protein
MQASGSRLRPIPPEGGDEVGYEAIAENAAPQTQAQDAQRKAIGVALQIALRTLSQKTIVALATLFSLLLAGSVFWVFMAILAEPTILKLSGAGIYAIFVLILHLVRKR